MITCSLCQKQYKQLFDEDSTQGDGCAADIIEHKGKKYLFGSYGSYLLDGDVYKVLTDKYSCGIICDTCFEENRNDFELLIDNQFFGFDLEEIDNG